MWLIEVFPANNGGIFEVSGRVDSGGEVSYCGDEAVLEEVFDVHIVDNGFRGKITTGEEQSVHGVTDKSVLRC